MPPRAAVLALMRRARRYQRWHEEPAIRSRTSFFAAAAIVNRALMRQMLLSSFLIELGAALETVNSQRALEILAGRRYREGSVERNTLDFIQYEQSIVQAHLDGLRRYAPRCYRREIRVINAVLATQRYPLVRGLAGRIVRSAALEALHHLGRPLDFAEFGCRVVLGAQIARHALLLSAPSRSEPMRILLSHAQGATSEC